MCQRARLPAIAAATPGGRLRVVVHPLPLRQTHARAAGSPQQRSKATTGWSSCVCQID